MLIRVAMAASNATSGIRTSRTDGLWTATYPPPALNAATCGRHQCSPFSSLRSGIARIPKSVAASAVERLRASRCFSRPSRTPICWKHLGSPARSRGTHIGTQRSESTKHHGRPQPTDGPQRTATDTGLDGGHAYGSEGGGRVPSGRASRSCRSAACAGVLRRGRRDPGTHWPSVAPHGGV